MRKSWLIAVLAVALGAAGGVAYQKLRAPSAPQAGEQAATVAPAAPAGGDVVLAQNEAPKLYPDDHILGKADAPLTIIEYASMTCPHCADFHEHTLPQIKTNYIDQGLARLVFRDFPLDKLALRASMLAECAPPEQYFNMVGVLFRTQETWARSADPMASLAQLGKTAGISQAKFDACMADQTLLDKILTRRQEAETQYNVNSTPTFIVNGRTLSGALPYEEFDKNFKELLPKS